MHAPSSIFSSEALVGWRRQSGRRWAWQLALLLGAVATLAVGFRGLDVLFRNPHWGAPDAEVLFIGTSHVTVRPEGLSIPMGRLWFPGLDMELAAAAYRRHRDLWPRLRLVFLEVDEFTLFTDAMGKHSDIGSIAGLLQLPAWELPNARREWRRTRWKLLSLATGDGIPALHPRERLSLGNLSRRFGWTPPREPLDVPYRATRQAAVKRIRYLAKLEADLPEYNARALIELSEMLLEAGIGVAYIGYPVHHLYAEARPPAWDQRLAATVAEARTRLAKPGLAYLDYRRDPRFGEADFRNIDHLNRAGSEKLARILSAEVLPALLAEAAQPH